ncbi:MAG: OmpA family protein [Bacteroidota bacterium]
MRKTLFWLFILFNIDASSQNLILNGDFEAFRACPVDFNQSTMGCITNWNQVGLGTPDYFNSCSREVGVPKNVFGNQPAHSGNGYAGIILFSNKDDDYREYLMTKLTRKLRPGEFVCVESFVSKADISWFISDQFGFLLTDKIPDHFSARNLELTPSISNPKLLFLDNESGWTRIGDMYQAKGGEQYLIMGSFSNDSNTKVLKENTSTEGFGDWSYIYIDDVRVKSISAPTDCRCAYDSLSAFITDPPSQLQEVGDVELDKLYFDFDKAELTQESIAKLEDVYSLMQRNTYVRLIISGHTDAIGSDGYNLGLSKRRSTRVINYLSERGIPLSRMEIKYFGAAEPIESNETDLGRSQNRRVEFQLAKMKFSEFNP